MYGRAEHTERSATDSKVLAIRGLRLVTGVDTHKDTHTAAVVQAVSGAVVDHLTVSATPAAAGGGPPADANNRGLR
jgi:hypothetical protein